MFILTKDFILAKELTTLANIDIANISMLYKDMENNNAAIKIGRDVYIRKNSPYLPQSIKDYIQKYKFTDLTDSLPVVYFCNELNINKNEFKEFKEIYKDNLSEFEVNGKKFVRFSSELKKMLKEQTFYTANKDELIECKIFIKSFIKLGKKYILIY